MTVNIERLSDLQLELQFKVPAAESEQAYQKHLKTAAKTVKMKGGYKQGSPYHLAAIDKQYGPSILQEACLELVEKHYRDAVREHQLMVAGAPQLKNSEPFKRKEDLKFSIVVESFPEVQLKDFSGEKLELFIGEATPEDVERELEKLRNEQKTWEIVDRAAKTGDQVIIDFEMYDENQEPVANGTAQKFQLVLGSGSMIPGFEDQFIQLKAGDAKEFKLRFPEDYHEKSLAGKIAHFKTKVHEVRETKLLDDEALLKKINFQKGGIAELKTEIRSFLEKQFELLKEEEIKNSVFSRLIELNPIAVPKAAVNAEIQNLQEAARQRIRQQFPNVSEDILKSLPLPREQYAREATKRVQLGVLIAAAMKKFNVQRDEQKVFAKLEKMVSTSPNPQQTMAAYQRNPRWMENIEELVLEDAVIAALLAQAQTAEKPTTMEMLLKHREERVAADQKAMAAPAEETGHVHDEHCQHDHHHENHHNHEAEKKMHDAQNRGLSPKYTDHSKPIHHGHSTHKKEGKE